MLWLAGIEGLLQCIEHKVRAHRAAHPPAHNAPGKHVDDKGHVQPALPGRNVGEVADSQLVRSLGSELTVDPIHRTWRLAVTDSGSYNLAPHHPAQPQLTHQPLDCAAGHCHPFAAQLAPYLVGAVDLHIGLPDTQNLRAQDLITQSPSTALVGRA